MQLGRSLILSRGFSSSYKNGFLVYDGPANREVRYYKRLVLGTALGFTVFFPIAALGFKLGTVSYGVGSRLFMWAGGSAGVGSLLWLFTKVTRSYVASLRTTDRENIWIAEVFDIFGRLKDVEINLDKVEQPKSKYCQFRYDGVDYFVFRSKFAVPGDHYKLGIDRDELNRKEDADKDQIKPL